MGSITSSAAYRPHGKCHWSIYRGSLLETAVYRPMGNPWSFIRLGLLQEPFHTAEPENTDVSRDGRRSPGSMFLEYWRHHISSRMEQSHFFFLCGNVLVFNFLFIWYRQKWKQFINMNVWKILSCVLMICVDTHSLGIKDSFKGTIHDGNVNKGVDQDSWIKPINQSYFDLQS